MDEEGTISPSHHNGMLDVRVVVIVVPVVAVAVAVVECGMLCYVRAFSSVWLGVGCSMLVFKMYYGSRLCLSVCSNRFPMEKLPHPLRIKDFMQIGTRRTLSLVQQRPTRHTTLKPKCLTLPGQPTWCRQWSSFIQWKHTLTLTRTGLKKARKVSRTTYVLSTFS